MTGIYTGFNAIFIRKWMIVVAENKEYVLTEQDKRFLKLYEAQEAKIIENNTLENQKKVYQPYLAAQRLVPAMIEAAEKQLPERKFVNFFPVKKSPDGKVERQVVGWLLGKIAVKTSMSSNEDMGWGSDPNDMVYHYYLISNGQVMKYYDRNGDYIFSDEFKYKVPIEAIADKYVSAEAERYIDQLKSAANHVFGIPFETIDSIIYQRDT